MTSANQMHGKPGLKIKQLQNIHYKRTAAERVLYAFLPFLSDFGLSPAYFSPHQCCSKRRSVFQWKPLINNNLHLKCNLILTTCALFVNWILCLKDKAGVGARGGWCCKCSGSALACEAKLLIYIRKVRKGHKLSDYICAKSFLS